MLLQELDVTNDSPPYSCIAVCGTQESTSAMFMLISIAYFVCNDTAPFLSGASNTGKVQG